jgi:hypothetical protein
VGLERRLERLEGRFPASQEAEKHQRTEVRRAAIAELEAYEARIRSMSEAEHRAWRESEEVQAEIRALEAELERRRRG